MIVSGAARLGIGAAHFGLGGGRVSDADARAVLARANAAGVQRLDASQGDGEAEAALGAVLPSPNPFRVVVRAAASATVPGYVDSAARTALATMWLPQGYALLAPSAADLAGPEGPALWTVLERLRGEGLYEKIGFSAFASDDPFALARRFRPDVVQLPVSLLDQRLIQNGALAALADMGVEVHVRSIFQDGLLFLPLERLPGPLTGSAARLRRTRAVLAECGLDPAHAAVRFALDRPEIACAVVDVMGLDELEGLLAAAETPAPDLDWAALALDDPIALDARRWAA